MIRVLIIAGSDSGGGAGIQADLRTCAAHGVFGTTAITAVTAQNTVGVQAAEALSPALVRAQIDSVLGDIGTDAVKIGMLANASIVATVADAVEDLRGDRSRLRPRFTPVRSGSSAAVPVVLDPVMVAKSGDSLLMDDAVEAMVDRLLPHATVVTPNVPELARLVGAEPATDEASRIEQARQLAAKGPVVLAKGGHAAGDTLVDLLVDSSGVIGRYRHPRQVSRATHGTGCTLSTALACRLAGRDDDDLDSRLDSAAAGAIDYLQGAIAAAVPIGAGHGPVEHLWRIRRSGETEA